MISYREELADIIELTARLSVLKRALRAAKEQGGANINLRKGGALQRHPWETPEKFWPTQSAYRTKGMPELPTLPTAVGVSISKGEGADFDVLSRPYTALHEIGHAADKKFNRWLPRASKVQWAILQGRVNPMKTGAKPRFVRAILESERDANRAAIANLKNAGASSKEIAEYKTGARRAFKTGYKIPHVGLVAQARHPKLVQKATEEGRMLNWKELRQIYRENPHLRTMAWQAKTPSEQVLRMIAR